MSGNGIDRLSYLCEKPNVQAAKVEVAVERAANNNLDAVALDFVNLLFEWRADYRKAPIEIKEINFDFVSFEDDIPDFSKITFNECMINSMHLASNVDVARLPKFGRCLIGSVDVAARGDLPKENFADCEVLGYADFATKTSSILDTDLPLASKVLLTLLNKLFIQIGRGRRENALYRGLDTRARGLVSEVILIIEEFGFASPTKMRGQTIWLPRREKTRRVNEIMSHPSTSSDPLIERIRSM